MYKCTDCGQEYEVKPDYCDCGNNVFEDLMPHKAELEEKQVNTENTSEKQSEETVDSVWDNPYKPKNNMFLQLLSILIFLSCIILAILSIIYIGKDSLAKIEQEKKARKITMSNEQNIKIPSLNSFWVENNNRIVNDEGYPIENVSKVVYSAPKKEIKSDIIPKEVKKQIVKKIVSQKTAQYIPQKSNVAKKQMTKTEQAQAVAKKTVKNITTNTARSISTATANKVQSNPIQTVKSVQTVSDVQLQREYANYKIELRNRISSNINFTQIIGDGVCAVSFKLDSSGNLMGRRFTKQSDNDSLNRVVYDAMMKNPTFSSPPNAYKGETLTLTVKMYGGHFAVTLN